MKKMLGILFVLGVLVASTSNVQAQETKDFQAIFEECGLGALLFPSWPIGASVSNFTWDFGTTATTSGLTTPDACKGGQVRLSSYIYKSYDSIEQDLAKGNGKYLDMLALFSDKTLEEKEAFIEAVRSKFRDFVVNENYSTLSRLQKAEMVYNIIVNDLG